jgi:predicted Zn-dependent peptidase
MSSRLFTEIREKRGLAYYVKAFNSNFTETGSFIVQAGLEVSQIKSAILVIKSILKDVAEKGITSEELVHAKEFLKGKYKLQFEDSASLAQWLATQKLLDNKLQTLDDKIVEVEKVSLNDVQSLAKQIFVFNKLSMAIIGPFSEQSFKKII